MNYDLHLIATVLIYGIFVYYIVLHGIYMLLILVGSTQIQRYYDGIRFGDFKRISESSLSLPVSIIIPTYNEETLIVSTVLGALRLRYPQFEIIVVNDGSDDSTLPRLIERFGLRRIDRVYKKHFNTQPIKAVYESPLYPNLVVVDKENGRRPDANNAGANFASYPLLCTIDADCILEEDALVRMVRPFLDDSRTIAAGGIVRPSNGIIVKDGEIISRDLPKTLLGMFQFIEYLRSFQWSRSGLARFNSMLCIAGAFMMVRKDVYVDIGGVDEKSICDDIDFTIALNRYIYDNKKKGKFRLAYVPDPVCYSEVPERTKFYFAQRNRWQRGILYSLLKNIGMTFNPRYGMAGFFGMPFFLVFEGFACLIEGAAYFFIPVGYYMGLATLHELALFFALGVISGTFVSILAILLEEHTRLRQRRTKDLILLLIAALFENLGYRQLHLIARIVGVFDYVIRRRTDWGERERMGFKEE